MNPFVKTYHSLPHYLPTALVIVTVLFLTLMPVPEKVVPDVDNADKVVHFAMFGAIACIGWLDFARHRHTAPLWSQYLIVALVSSLLGGLIELLQATDFVNRSGDFFDFAADAAGAFILPPLLRRPLWMALPLAQKVSLRTVALPSPALKSVYLESFPPEEQRPWENIELRAADTREPLQFTEVLWMGRPKGLISWWNFPQWSYLEHFAISSSLRGGGIGAEAIREWLKMINKPAVLEVELPGANDMAQRRIRFYERLGFTPHHEWPYLQPPYSPQLAAVPLMLMTHGDIRNLKEVENVLHKQVYGAKQ